MVMHALSLLSLLSLLPEAAAVAGAAQCAAVKDRVDCSSGNTELSEADCVARQCCWHPQRGLGGAAPDECLTGTVNTPARGVVGSMAWSQHVEFGGGKTIDGVPVSAEILGYVHNGQHGGPGPCCGNKFTVSTANVTSTGFDLRVVRTDGSKAKPGWGQELILGWKAGPSSCAFPHIGPSPPGPPAPAKNSSCFFPAEGSPIEVVHMINSNHFDAGYADWTSKVLNKYFDLYFPLAAHTGKALMEKTGMPLRWMTFSYIVSLYMDCPAGYGLHCPTAAAKATFVEAVKAEHIVWAGFPTNAELATGDKSILQFGVKMSQDAADKLGVSRPSVVSTRDVPGMPRSAIPILKEAGVTAMSEGMNGRMVMVNAPPVFNWHDPNSGEEMLTLWHWHGYGGVGDPGWLIRVPGSTHALAYVWRGDNAGPPIDADEVVKNVASVKSHPLMARFPKAQVITSTFENISAVWADEAQLPVVTQELADTWIWGTGSDPVKVAKMRAMHRLRTACEDAHEPRCVFSDPAYFNFSRQIQKNLEHTWGVSVTHYGNLQNSNWTNAEFHADLEDQNTDLEYMVQSWIEQRNYGVNFPLEALKAKTHPLATKIEAEFAAMEPKVPLVPPAGMKAVPLTGGVLKALGGWADVGFDSKTGAITHLAHSTTSKASIAGPNNPLLLVRYQALVESDFDAWRSEYILPGAGGFNEYGKPEGFMTGPDGKPINGCLAPGTLAQAYVSDDKTSLLLGLRFDEKLHTDFGAPASAWMRVHFNPEQPGEVTASLTLVNKTATRLPEAAWVTNTPIGSVDGNWSMDKLGGAVSPLDVAVGASRGLHNILTGVNFTSKSGKTVFFGSSDAGVVRWDTPLPFPTPLHRQPDLSFGQSWMLFNNIWSKSRSLHAVWGLDYHAVHTYLSE